MGRLLNRCAVGRESTGWAIKGKSMESGVPSGADVLCSNRENRSAAEKREERKLDDGPIPRIWSGVLLFTSVRVANPS